MKITLEAGQTWHATIPDKAGRLPCRVIKRLGRGDDAGYVLIEVWTTASQARPRETNVSIPAMKAWIASRNARLER